MTPVVQFFVIFAALQATLAEPAQHRASDPFLVIVNTENQFESDEDTMKTVLSRLFLSDQKNWPDGSEAIIFARPPGSAEQLAFQEFVLEKSAIELSEHWLRLKQTQGETPPRAISSSRILLRQINMKPDAVSVISREDFDAYVHAFDHVQILYSFEGVIDE